MTFSSAHALVIGVSHYLHLQGSNVLKAKTDATEVASVLKNPAFCGYPESQISLLSEHNATRANILAEFDRIAQILNEDSTFLLFYVGHGDYSADSFYTLTTYDSRVEKSRIVPGTGISEVDLLNKLRQIKAKRTLLIFNSCHAGEISPSLDLAEKQPDDFGSASLPEKTGATLLSTGEGRIIITACRPAQKSWLGPGKLSLFGEAVVSGMKGDGMLVQNNQGYISAFSLYEHIYSSTQKAAKQLGYDQEPELTVLHGIGPFPVSLYKGAERPGNFDPKSETIPEEMAIKEVDPTLSKKLYDKSVRIYQATLNGDGAIAQGNGSRAVGKGGVFVEGDININVQNDLSGNLIIGGDNNVGG